MSRMSNCPALAIVLRLGVLLAALLASRAAAEEAASRAEELFVHRVHPMFKEKCFACHGEDPQDVRGEFNMLSRQGLLTRNHCLVSHDTTCPTAPWAKSDRAPTT